MLAADPTNPLFLSRWSTTKSRRRIRYHRAIGAGLKVTTAYTDMRIAADTTIPVGNRPLVIDMRSRRPTIFKTLKGFGISGGTLPPASGQEI